MTVQSPSKRTEGTEEGRDEEEGEEEGQDDIVLV
jgi:hypothetical protein